MAYQTLSPRVRASRPSIAGHRRELTKTSDPFPAEITRQQREEKCKIVGKQLGNLYLSVSLKQKMKRNWNDEWKWANDNE